MNPGIVVHTGHAANREAALSVPELNTGSQKRDIEADSRLEASSRRLLTRRSLLGALSLGGAGLLSSCISIPTSGSVGVATVLPTEADVLVQEANGPQDGEAPLDIVSGFMLACQAGFSDDFATARDFLHESLVASWEPLSEVRIYHDEDAPTMAQASDGAVEVSNTIVASLDEEGVLHGWAQDAVTTHSYTLVRNALGQWRIAEMPNGLTVPRATLLSNYASRTLTFPTWDAAELLTELRWVPQAVELQATLNALLEGPSTWLASAIWSQTPQGLTATVSLDSGVASVHITEPEVSLSERALGVLVDQIRETLGKSTGVETVRVFLGEDDVSDSTAGLALSARQAQEPVMLRAGAVIQGLDSPAQITSVEALGTRQARWPFRGPRAVATVEGRNLRRTVIGEAGSTVVFSGPSEDSTLTAPSLDRVGWAWFLCDGELTAVNSLGQAAVPEISWLDQESWTIIAVDVSPEGERLTLSLQGSEYVVTVAAAILRLQDGTPLSLGPRINILAATASNLITLPVWSDPVTVVCLIPSSAGSGVQVRYTQAGGVSTFVAAPGGATGLAGNRVDGQLLLWDEEGQIWQREGSTWRIVTRGVSDPSYPLPYPPEN